MWYKKVVLTGKESWPITLASNVRIYSLIIDDMLLEQFTEWPGEEIRWYKASRKLILPASYYGEPITEEEMKQVKLNYCLNQIHDETE